MTVRTVEDADEPMTLRTKVVASLVAVVALLGAGYGLLRLSSPMIELGQTPPPGHYSFDCPICHTVTPAPPATATP